MILSQIKQMVRLRILVLLLMSCTSSLIYAESMTLNLKDADINAVIATVSEMTGKNFIVDPRVKGKVTVISSKPMEADEIYEVFLSILNVHGFSAVPGKNTVKIVPHAEGKQSPIPVATQRKQGDGDQLVTRIIHIENVPASQLVPILRPLLPQQGHLAAYPPTNVLIASDTAENLKRIVKLIDEIDKGSDSDIELVPLKNASADEVVRIITSLTQKSGKNNSPESEVDVLADPRSNTVLISGDKASRSRIKKIITSLDMPNESTGNTKVFYLKYANAKDLVAVLTGIGKSIATESPDPKRKQLAQSSLNIQADESTNAIVLNAPTDVIRELESIIRQLDVRRAQVIVKAIIAEISQDNVADFGFNWAAYDPSKSIPLATVDFNGSLASMISDGLANQASTGKVLVTPPTGLSLGFGDVASGGTGYLALLKAIKGNTSNNILSTPTLVTLDNEEAEIVVGQNVPFVTGSYTSSTAGSTATNPFQTIKREDVGLSLKIKPQINEGDSIRLEISQEVSSVSNSAGTASDLITNKRSLKTTVMVDDGQVLALGGLVDETVGEVEQKIPLLGDIPLLGWLFKYKKATKVKRDLTIFLYPQIIRDGKQGAAISNHKYTYLRAQQLESNDRGFEILTEDNPVLPDLKDLMELPPPYEPSEEEKREVE